MKRKIETVMDITKAGKRKKSRLIKKNICRQEAIKQEIKQLTLIIVSSDHAQEVINATNNKEKIERELQDLQKELSEIVK